MQIDDPSCVVVQQCFGNDLTKICKERRLCTNRLDARDFGGVTNPSDVLDPQSGAGRPGVDWGWQERATATGGPWWRRDNSNNVESGVRCSGTERRDCESATPK